MHAYRGFANHSNRGFLSAAFRFARNSPGITSAGQVFDRPVALLVNFEQDPREIQRQRR